jgi:hypothetical protein
VIPPVIRGDLRLGARRSIERNRSLLLILLIALLGAVSQSGCATNGTTWVPLHHISGKHYTGRQFVFDWTGIGYTQVQMRIVFMVGSNAGVDYNESRR